MSEAEVTLSSDGLALAGVIGLPEDLRPGEKRSAFIVMHGFGTNMHCKTEVDAARMLQKLGYVTLRFDMRGSVKAKASAAALFALRKSQTPATP